MTNHDDSTGEASQEEAAVKSEPRQPRFSVDLDLTLDSEAHFHVGSATNLSRGGFFVAAFIIQEPGEVFRFTIRLPSNTIIKGRGEVRWLRQVAEGPDEPVGMGIRFVELEPGSAEAIEEYLVATQPPAST